ncbi:putative late blight resistance protein homolog R1B-16 isoform X2 [Olea europaea var. sylvestris]|uniref:putative late blight resistance protein homolog R1B-16 isoform X2 n=1 Tax=Olea europaea var. sylvestris TaxID=158386 RepID=UPI000C1CD8CF|nr:putative late blight resistance protein homolog R1B-16 isoform X2 [Olea europaea var. sylvestris]
MRYNKLHPSSKIKSRETKIFSHVKEVTEEIDSITREMEKIEQETDIQDLQPRTWFPAGSSKSASGGKINTVGLDDDMIEIKNRLTGGSSNLETVSVVGMGGMGKTTLTRKLYDDELIVYHFYIRAWVTVSQDYNLREMLLGLLDSMEKLTDQMREENNETLAEILYKNLKGMRYLIVMDDVWDAKVWDDIKRSFPKDKNGSRIMMTTRLDNVARYASSTSPPHPMRFLSDDESWKLFCENVFVNNFCPPELEEIGRKIARGCQGLPLAIVVIAGLLSKSPKTQLHWKNVGESLSSVFASYDDQCLKIISLSYRYLPHHLKGCFLYMGIFPEDFDISVSKLLKLWVVEGLLEPVISKSLEAMAQEYFLDLVDRNLILVREKSSLGKIKTCRIHDLLRDLCVREAQREKFFQVSSMIPHGISDGIMLHRLIIDKPSELIHHASVFSSSKHLKSLFSSASFSSPHFANLRLLRVLDIKGEYINYFHRNDLINMWYLACFCSGETLPASVYKMRNLKVLIIYNYINLEVDIWKMPELCHVKLKRGKLPDPLSAEIEGGNSTTVLENLQTLSQIKDFRCTEEILKRIPNLKKLGICYVFEPMDSDLYCLKNVGRLHKLESLNCYIFPSLSSSFLQNLTLPPSLKKLTLSGSHIPWEDMTILGSLPNLQVLKLKRSSFYGREWEPNEGEFLQLKFLLLEGLNLVEWRADNIHFPCLQHLVLKTCYSMEEIPSVIGEIPTLQSIILHKCRDSLVASAKQIQEEQLSLGIEGLEILIHRN